MRVTPLLIPHPCHSDIRHTENGLITGRERDRLVERVQGFRADIEVIHESFFCFSGILRTDTAPPVGGVTRRDGVQMPTWHLTRDLLPHDLAGSQQRPCVDHARRRTSASLTPRIDVDAAARFGVTLVEPLAPADD